MSVDRHTIERVSFPDGMNVGPLECSCGWEGRSDRFGAHRYEAGAGQARDRIVGAARVEASAWTRRVPRRSSKALCAAPDGCDRPAKTAGLCGGHYERLRRGAPLEGPIGAPRGIHARVEAVAA